MLTIQFHNQSDQCVCDIVYMGQIMSMLCKILQKSIDTKVNMQNPTII